MSTGFSLKRVPRAITAKRLQISIILLLIILLTILCAVSEAKDGRETMRSKKRISHRRLSRTVLPSEACPVCEQVTALSQRVDELSRQLAAQKASSVNQPVEDGEARREISELKARLNAAEERAAAAEQSAASLHTEVTKTSQAEVRAETKIEKVASTLTETATTVEKVAAQTKGNEAAIKRVGPFRFSGDFRLRADAILRPAFTNPGPGQTALPHVQNVRGRYRVRLNFDADPATWLSFHGQLATGPVNNALTFDQEFGSAITRHPFFLSEAYVDFHPVRWFSAQGGKLPDVFADNSRFLLDDDVRFNGFNEKFIYGFAKKPAGFKSIELRAGQYILTNPNIAIVTNANLGLTGAVIGSTGRGSEMFHQGLLINQQLSERVAQQFGGDIQLYRNPNQIQFASTQAGLPVLVQGGLGLALSGPLAGTGNATTTPGGAIYTARNFQVARLTWRLDHKGFKHGEYEYPLAVNLQVARNLGTGQRERDAMFAALSLGKVKNRGDQAFSYLFTIKGANALISQLTDDDLGTLTGVNIRAHHLRYDLGLAKGIQLQSLFFIQNELRSSGQYPNFFVPLNAFTPRQYRLQEQIVFTF